MKKIYILLLLLVLAAFPLVAPLLGLDFYIGFVRRVLVVALAAASLNFILGFGGMVALGHAGFIGMGAYTVVALSDAGVMSAWVMWPLAALVAGVVAALIGTVCVLVRPSLIQPAYVAASARRFHCISAWPTTFSFASPQYTDTSN